MKTSAKYYDLTVGAQGQVKLVKVAKKSSTYNVTHKKPAPPNQKNFFHVQTTRLAASFDTSTRSKTRTRAEIFPHKATCDPAVFCEPLGLTRFQSVKLIGWAKSHGQF